MHLNQKEKCEHLPDAVCIVSVSAVRPYDFVKDNAFTALPFSASNFLFLCLIYSLPTVSSSCIRVNSVSISLTSLSLLSFLYTIQIIISPTCTLVVPLTTIPQCNVNTLYTHVLDDGSLFSQVTSCVDYMHYHFKQLVKCYLYT